MTDICRLCASLKTLENLITIGDPNLSIKKKLIRCCQLELPDGDDLLPQNVCNACVQGLENCWMFAENVAQAQETLRKAFSVDFIHGFIGSNEENNKLEQDELNEKSGLPKTCNNNKEKRRLAEFSIKLKSAIVSLHIKNYTVNQIASKLNLNAEEVQYWINTYDLLRKSSQKDPPETISIPLESEFIDTSLSYIPKQQSLSSETEQIEIIHDVIDQDDETDDKRTPIEKNIPLEFEGAVIIEEQYDDFPVETHLDDDSSQASDLSESEAPVEDHPWKSDQDEDRCEVKSHSLETEDFPKETWTDLTWKCVECEKHFSDVASMRSHADNEHPDSSVRYPCVDCSKVFSKYYPYIRHVRNVHRPHLKYCCDVCCEFYWDLNELNEHSAKHSPSERSYLCQTCGKGFENSARLYAHRRSHIPSEQRVQYSCEICTKTFSTKPNLVAHKRIHTGVREFTCEQCGKSFVQKGNLENHMLTHASNKPFNCEVCGKSFKTTLRLSKHKRVHTDYRPHKCNICGREFREKGTLSEHMRIHSGAMPYECEFCGKRFRFKGVLTTHRRLHTGERPYSCLDCSHHFTNWPNYNKHMKRRHGINTSVTVRKPQTIPPSGMPAKAKQNHVVPTLNNLVLVPATTTTATDVDHNETNLNVEVKRENSTGNEEIVNFNRCNETSTILIDNGSIIGAITGAETNLNLSHQDQITVQIQSDRMPSTEQQVTTIASRDNVISQINSQYAYIPANGNLLGGYYNIQTVDVNLIRGVDNSDHR